MRARFSDVMSDVLVQDPQAALVLADIGPIRLLAGTPAGERVVNVGIREQAMIGVAAGLALAGLRPVVHTYAPFLVERPFEQIKLDLSHQDLGAVLVSIGASYDASVEGRTHQCPGDVALLSTLPDWRVHTPGHPDEVEAITRGAVAARDRQYIRLSSQQNAHPFPADGSVHAVRQGSGTLLLAIGPMLAPALAATSDLEVGIAYTSTPLPLDAAGLRRLADGYDRVLVLEPFLEGTLAYAVSAALRGRGLRIEHLGVGHSEWRHYGTPADHSRWHGLDAAGIRRRLSAFS
ncbi:transketolase family protein [Microbacterium sp. TNHR37B]|uniref:transketolase family protein n=1 Tax=Microbacterium sp. TNHR37B TaxID=1775956 RepID=UPI0007B2AF35|nr:transketolase [Microbacterium sp. TNHR37B]KZE91607.1 putative 33.6 kDa protein in fasciation locus [Microbacterium sp. TNHR37B]